MFIGNIVFCTTRDFPVTRAVVCFFLCLEALAWDGRQLPPRLTLSKIDTDLLLLSLTIGRQR